MYVFIVIVAGFAAMAVLRQYQKRRARLLAMEEAEEQDIAMMHGFGQY